MVPSNYWCCLQRGSRSVPTPLCTSDRFRCRPYNTSELHRLQAVCSCCKSLSSRPGERRSRNVERMPAESNHTADVCQVEFRLLHLMGTPAIKFRSAYIFPNHCNSATLPLEAGQAPPPQLLFFYSLLVAAIPVGRGPVPTAVQCTNTC
jgi:hypothetical protein